MPNLRVWCMMKSILLVDDEVTICAELEQTLKQLGFRVETAPTIESALGRIRRTKFDAILVEFNLKSNCKTHPRAGNGLQLVRRIRALRIRIPVLMFTVMEGELYEKASRDAGADGFVQKTIPIPSLVARLNAHVRSYEQEAGKGCGIRHSIRRPQWN